MREHDLPLERRRRFVATTDSDHNPIFPDLARDRIVDGPNHSGWRISPISRSQRGSSIWPQFLTPGHAALGYAISRSIDARVAVAALKAAIRIRQPPKLITTRIVVRNTPPSPTATCWPT